MTRNEETRRALARSTGFRDVARKADVAENASALSYRQAEHIARRYGLTPPLATLVAALAFRTEAAR